MSLKWSCLVVVLFVAVTSSAVLDFHGNGANRHGDCSPDVRDVELLTPPIEVEEEPKPVNHANEAICRELCKKGQGGNACLCDWPPFKKQVFFAIKKVYKERPIPFLKFPTIEDDIACRLLCPNGEDDHFCMCSFANL